MTRYYSVCTRSRQLEALLYSYFSILYLDEIRSVLASPMTKYGSQI